MKTYNYDKWFTFMGRRYRVRADSKEELAVKLALKKRDLEEGKYVVNGNATLRDWFYKYVDLYKTGQKDVTRRTYVNRVEHCILEEIGDMCLKDIRPITVQEVMNKQAGKSKTQVNEIYQALKSIFKYAALNHLIIEDPAQNLIKPPYKAQSTRRALTPEERELILKVAKSDRRYYVFLLMLLCGCRPSEAAECKGMDILTVQSKNPLKTQNRALHIRGAKTTKADRIVPLPDELYELIKKTPKNDYIACMGSGSKLTKYKMSRVWKSFKRALNLEMGAETYRNAIVNDLVAPDLEPYCLRHEYCTDLARRGVDIRIAQKLMGHSSIELTSNIYTNLSDDDVFVL